MIENKKYFIDQINSSKANKMTSLYHYSGISAKNAKINLGIFRKSDLLMVGVLQFGCSFQEKIKLNRYVKEPIKKDEYLELNRFSMADSEGKNSESQAISLGIKWIKQNMPEVRLLVSYAGRKEGNYGYIYQATNWEYLGYFISQGFWFVDGEERHLTTLWYRYSHYGNQNLPFSEGICEMYEDVRKTWTKQFIYIQRLDKKLTPATPTLAYPKPSTDYPIKVKEIIYKQNDKIFNNFQAPARSEVKYYYEKDKQLFSNTTLIRRGEKQKTMPLLVATYDLSGKLLSSPLTIIETAKKYSVLADGIRHSSATGKSYKNKYYRRAIDKDIFQEQIDVPILCLIDEIPFNSFAEVGRYLGVSRQAVYNAHKRKSQKITNKKIIWGEPDAL